MLYHILDAYLGTRDKDWNQAMYDTYVEGEAELEERRAREEEARVEGTSPSHDPEAYTGTYVDSLYGTVEVKLEDSGLVLEVGPQFIGDLEHWHFDTFRARWRDESLGRAWVQFRLDRSGKVSEVEVEGWRPFHKTEEEG